MKKLQKLAVCVAAICLSMTTLAQQDEKAQVKNDSTFEFTIDKKIEVTPVRDQYRSGTCWSFSALAMMEAEMIRIGKPAIDLSEMWIVRKAYEQKAKKYVRMHGTLNFGGGGAANDVPDMIREFGIMPDSIYNGLQYGLEKHTHGEMDYLLKTFIDGVLKNKNKSLTTSWFTAYSGILDAYLGPAPKTFMYENNEYTPKTFAKEVVGLNMDDYVMISSFSHHPFYSQFVIEVPDNWSWGQVYNVPLDELMSVFDNSIKNGYTLTWAADVSEKGFSWRNGVALVPDMKLDDMSGTEKEKWEKLSEKERKAAMLKLNKPVPEKKINQEYRQLAFDNYETTDDHGMLISGMAHDQNGTKYYLVKNSWNTKNPYQGYFYASESFVRYKTMSILVHKDAVPKALRKKLGIK